MGGACGTSQKTVQYLRPTMELLYHLSYLGMFFEKNF